MKKVIVDEVEGKQQHFHQNRKADSGLAVIPQQNTGCHGAGWALRQGVALQPEREIKKWYKLAFHAPVEHLLNNPLHKQIPNISTQVYDSRKALFV